MKLSYAIPVCNEFVEIQRLITFLLKNKRDEDEIVVLFDSNNGDKEVETYLRKMNVEKTLFKWASYKFEGDFAAMKNRLNSLCSGDYIFQIDADEMPNEYMMKIIPDHGVPYYLHKEDQQSDWVNVGPNPPIAVPKWILFRF